eukprot:m51a1_g9214 putative 3 5 -cyclic nucleotide phosphodiesterase family protein (893) ;mRNA; r:32947-36309
MSPRLCLWAGAASALLLCAGAARALHLDVMESTILRCTTLVDNIYYSIESAVSLVGRQAEQAVALSVVPEAHLTDLTYRDGPYPLLVDLNPNRTTEFWLSTDALTTLPDPLLVGPFKQFGDPRCWCRDEWLEFCNKTERVRAGKPCMGCERACDTLWGLRITKTLDPILRPLVPDHPFTLGWLWTRGIGEEHRDWGRVWTLWPYSVSTGHFSYVGIGVNATPWTPRAPGGFVTAMVEAKRNNVFDRKPVWSPPFYLAPRKMGVPLWSRDGEYLGGFFTNLPMSASKSFFLNLSVVSPIPFVCAMAYSSGQLIAASDEAIAQLWGTCFNYTCNLTSLNPELDAIAKQQGDMASTYWEVSIRGTRYIAMHQSLQLGWKLWFFIRYSDAFPDMPVGVMTALFIVAVIFMHRMLRRQVLTLEEKLGSMATSNVIGLPAEDAIRSLIKVQKEGKLRRDLREEVACVMALIATNKLFKADTNLKEKLQELKLEKDVDAFLISVLTDKEKPEVMSTEATLLLEPGGSSVNIPPGKEAKGSVSGSSVVTLPDSEEIENAVALVSVATPAGATPVFESWDCDVCDITPPKGVSLLEVVTMAALEKNSLFAEYGFDRHAVQLFLKTVERGYKDNPYHNSAHAADVVQAMHSLISDCKGIPFTPLEKLAALIAAACHDYGHWGVNNTFLQATMDALYVQYNGVSVLESMHSAESMRLMLGLGSGRSSTKEDREREGGGGQERGSFVRGKLTREDTYELHRSVAQLILATDMARHLELTSLFATRTTAGKMDPASKADRLLVLQMLIKASDVSNPARPWPACHRWARRVMDEFFAQGDAERALGLRVSPFMDRATADTPKCQLAFIKFVVRPMMELIVPVCPAVAQRMLEHLTVNQSKWEGLSS